MIILAESKLIYSTAGLLNQKHQMKNVKEQNRPVSLVINNYCP